MTYPSIKFKNIIKRIVSQIKKSSKILIAGHESPDGDTVGASLALARAINKNCRGKKMVEVRSKKPLPSYLEFLPGASKIKTGAISRSDKYDLAIILECSDIERTGDIIDKSQVRKIINIDHHAVPSAFGDINYIDAKSSAVSCQIFYIIKSLGCPIDKEIAECLYTGILTDTGKFQQKNTSPEAFAIAAECLKEGKIDIASINENVYTNKSAAALRLLGAALSSLEIVADGKIALITLRMEDFSNCGAAESDTEEIINYPMFIKDVEAVVFFRQISVGRIKVSMRSKGHIDVLRVATAYGGGGHRHAAGFSITTDKKTIDEVKKEVSMKFLM